MERVLAINGVQLIGINNRSLETFIVDTSNTKTLLEKHGDAIREKGILVVGESGLFTPDDVAYVQNAGVSAVSYLFACGLIQKFCVTKKLCIYIESLSSLSHLLFPLSSCVLTRLPVSPRLCLSFSFFQVSMYLSFGLQNICYRNYQTAAAFLGV
ncbi:unnamed protein product [Triticum turgidum subsp. durum]|uniref:indole-3-glycerol-phosphate synthase n=1 Tax=Triticum turgidum subsp. durum TaxID=4567 RepID=A0A9R0ZQC7_TRITD|nr:unnamed protein product [Triticum turgidum subsp. durum]